LDQSRDVELALARETAEMTTPGEHIHLQSGCIGELQKKDPVAWHVRDAG
jgi:hypothetical protein